MIPLKKITSQKARKSFLSEILLALTALVIASPAMTYLILAYLNLDFWRDELHSLEVFVFVPLKTVLTYYPAPNNHIFANLLNHIYVYGIRLDYISLLENPWKIRILMLAYSVVTSIYAYLIGRDFFGQIDGIAIVGVLWTTLPFLNFAVQVRGYSLSIMLLCVVIYYSLRFYESASWKTGTIVSFGTMLMLYTIPSNIYIILSMILYWFVLVLINSSGKRKTDVFYSSAARIAGLKIAGCILAVLLYSPVLTNVIENDYVKKTGFVNMSTLTNLTPGVIVHFLSGRWLLLILAFIGVLILIRGMKNREEPSFFINFLLTPTLMIAPFMLSAIRGDSPYDRTFVPLVIPFAIFFGVTLSTVIRVLSGYILVFFVTIVISSTFLSFYYIISERDRILYSDLESGGRSQNILANYYQRYYTPSALMKEFMAQYEEGSIFVNGHWVDRVAMPRYMLYWAEIYGKTIDEWHKSYDLYLQKDWLQSGKAIYVFTNKPDAVRILEGHHPEITCTRITSPGQLGMVLRCVHRNLSQRPALAQPDRSQPWVSLGKGWHPVERNESETFRWGSADNRIWLVNPYDTPIHVTLALTLDAYETTRPAELWDGRRLLARWEVQQVRRTYHLGMTIAPGHTRLQLRAPTAFDRYSPRELSVRALQWRIANYVAVERK